MSKIKAKKTSLPVKLLKFFFHKKVQAKTKNRRSRKGKKHCCAGCALFRLLGRIFGIFAALYAVLFTVFFFDLDGKLLYYVVEPLLVKHYDKMERRNPLDMPYDIKE
ncbi:MAG: hypothetical protein J5449_03025 [Oscillospiraceae bacterium]|nr:hypothetical protein [Oscillospiraceae bacterium]